MRRSFLQSSTSLLRYSTNALEKHSWAQFTVQNELVSLQNFQTNLALNVHLHTKPSHYQQHSSTAASSSHPTATILDGRAVAANWETELADQVKEIRDRGGRPPGLGVILVGDRPDSHLYVTRKQEACDRIGMHSVIRHLPSTVSQIGMRQAVRALCADPTIDGVLVQLPLPAHIDEEDVIEHFDPSKDVDGFHPLNVGRTLMRGRSARFVPCTALGCVELLRRTQVPIQGKSVAIVGDSNIVGMPLAMLFRDEGAATVTVIHRTSYSSLFSGRERQQQISQQIQSAENPEQRAAASACLTPTPGPQSHRTAQPYEVSYSSGLRDAYMPRNGSIQSAAAQEEPPSHLTELAGITRTADILVVAVGYPLLVKGDWIKDGAVVLDVGINVVDWGDVPASPPPLLSDANENINSDNNSSAVNGIVDNQRQGSWQQQRNEGSPDEEHSQFHVVGDVDFSQAMEVASAVTPVPGGVGPMTIAAVLHNTVHAAAIKLGLRSEGAFGAEKELDGSDSE